MQVITITGNCGKDPEKRTTQSNDEVCSFSVGVKQGWGDKASTNWYRCNVWGKRAGTVAQHLRKGSKVTVNGELSIGEYNGKAQFDIRVNDVDWQPSGDRQAQGGAPADNYPPLDDDVPF
jgi:single-strand DNA-binding protein